MPLAGYRWVGLSPVFAFWFAYVLTRPLGASVADWLGKPVGEGGLGIGPGWVSLGFLVIMTILVGVMVRRVSVASAESTAVSLS